MSNRGKIVFAVLHFCFGIGGFLVVNGWALGVTDAGGTAVPAGLAAVAPVVRYGLLQPFAIWLIEAAGVAWWTWPGLLLTVVIVALNSCAVVFAVDRVWGRLRGRTSR